MNGALLADLRRLRASLLLACTLLLAGIATAAYSARWLAQEQRNLAEAEARQRQVQAQLAEARREAAEIDARIALFRQLQARGVVGAEARLDWVEAVEALRRSIGLPRLEYELLPQHPLTLPGADAEPAAYHFAASTMRLRMDLVHEGDLLQFLDQLPPRVGAILRLRACLVERPGEGAVPQRAGLSADCVLDWITLQPVLDGVRP